MKKNYVFDEDKDTKLSILTKVFKNGFVKNSDPWLDQYCGYVGDDVVEVGFGGNGVIIRRLSFARGSNGMEWANGIANLILETDNVDYKVNPSGRRQWGYSLDFDVTRNSCYICYKTPKGKEVAA